MPVPDQKVSKVANIIYTPHTQKSICHYSTIYCIYDQYYNIYKYIWGLLFFWLFFLIQDLWNIGYPETQRHNYLCLPSAGSKHKLTLSPDQVILKSQIIMYFHLLLSNIQTVIHHRTDPLYLGLGNYHINFRALLSPSNDQSVSMDLPIPDTAPQGLQWLVLIIS